MELKCPVCGASEFDRHCDVLIRVGGSSAKSVTPDRSTQNEVIERSAGRRGT